MKAINIGKLSFTQYIGKRLEKDGLGYVPCAFNDSCTDMKTYIKAPIPLVAKDFLAFAHELGHAVGKQVKDRGHHSSAAFWGTTYWSPDCLLNEFLAWDWAFRYVKRLGFVFSKKELEDILSISLVTYLDNIAEETNSYANSLINKYCPKWGVHINHVVSKKFKAINSRLDTRVYYYLLSDESKTFEKYTKTGVLEGTWISRNEFTVKPFEEVAKSKGNKRKAWMEIVDEKNKQFYKRNGGKK